MFINSNWATNFTVRDTKCTAHYELMTVSFRPHYLPREFGQITVILVYVPGPDFKLAADNIAASYNKALRHSGDDPVFLLGDFNSCDVSPLLPNLEQYVTCTTRLNKTLDRCYGNVEGAYASRSRPPLGLSDHNVIHLLPKYRQSLKRTKPTVIHCQAWTDSALDTLRGCFEATEWELLTTVRITMKY